LWRQAAPHAETFPCGKRELETGLTDLADRAHGLGFLDLLFYRREEELDRDLSTSSAVLPFLVRSHRSPIVGSAAAQSKGFMERFIHCA
jgi:hypothetical protein